MGRESGGRAPGLLGRREGKGRAGLRPAWPESGARVTVRGTALLSCILTLPGSWADYLGPVWWGRGRGRGPVCGAGAPGPTPGSRGWTGLLGVWAEEKWGVAKLEVDSWGLGPAPVPCQLRGLEQGSSPAQTAPSSCVLGDIKVLALGPARRLREG